MTQQTDLDALDALVGAATKGEIEIVQRFANRWDLQVSVPGFIPRVLGHSSVTVCEVGCGTDEEAKANALAWAALKNNYAALAAELREARRQNELLTDMYFQAQGVTQDSELGITKEGLVAWFDANDSARLDHLIDRKLLSCDVFEDAAEICIKAGCEDPHNDRRWVRAAIDRSEKEGRC